MARQQENSSTQEAIVRGHSVSMANQRRKRTAALLSIVSNTVLTLLKLVVGVLSGAVSILSEAVHSATDLIASMIAFYSVRVSDTPPDDDHPYGHGKIESLSGLAEASLIFGAAIYIIYEAVSKLLHPAQGFRLPVSAGLGVMAFSAVSNTLISRYLSRVAQETDSLALEADAAHLRTDVWTSIGVLAGLTLAHLTRYVWLDPVVALLVALLILHAAYELARNALLPLMDARLPAEEEAAIQHILETDNRVLSYHKLRTRKSGSHRHVDVHVQVEDDYSLVEAHEVTEELEDRIRAALPAIQINIHIEPYHAEMRHQQEVHGLSIEALNRDETTPEGEKGRRGEGERGNREQGTGNSTDPSHPSSLIPHPSKSAQGRRDDA